MKASLEPSQIASLFTPLAKHIEELNAKMEQYRNSESWSKSHGNEIQNLFWLYNTLAFLHIMAFYHIHSHMAWIVLSCIYGLVMLSLVPACLKWRNTKHLKNDLESLIPYIGYAMHSERYSAQALFHYETEMKKVVSFFTQYKEMPSVSEVQVWCMQLTKCNDQLMLSPKDHDLLSSWLVQIEDEQRDPVCRYMLLCACLLTLKTAQDLCNHYGNDFVLNKPILTNHTMTIPENTTLQDWYDFLGYYQQVFNDIKTFREQQHRYSLYQNHDGKYSLTFDEDGQILDENQYNKVQTQINDINYLLTHQPNLQFSLGDTLDENGKVLIDLNDSEEIKEKLTSATKAIILNTKLQYEYQ